MEGDRAVAPPKGVIAKINVISEDGGGLGLDKGDEQRLEKAVAFAIKHILGGSSQFVTMTRRSCEAPLSL